MNWADITGATYGDDYTLEYLSSGELPGYTLLTVGILSTLSADIDSDGDDDGDDFLIWQSAFNASANGDADGDGDTDGDDFLIWQTQFGPGSSSASLAVPEPASSAILVFVVLLLGSRQRRRVGRCIS